MQEQTLHKLQQILKRQRSKQSGYIFILLLSLGVIGLSFIGLADAWPVKSLNEAMPWTLFYGVCALFLIGSFHEARKATAQIRLCKATIQEFDNQGGQVDTFALAYQTTTMADKHEQEMLRRQTVWLLPKILIGLMFVISSMGMIATNTMQIIQGDTGAASISSSIFGVVWALFWGRVIYKSITQFRAQRRITKETKRAAKTLREQRQASVGAMSVAQAHTSSGAMSLAQEHEGGLTDVATLQGSASTHARSNSGVVLDFDASSTEDKTHEHVETAHAHHDKI